MLDILTGLVLVVAFLFLPGYFITLGAFPRRNEVDLIERVVFSFAFSITLLPLLILFENQLLQIPINYLSVLATFLILIIVGLGIWLVRTRKMQPGEAAKLLPELK